MRVNRKKRSRKRRTPKSRHILAHRTVSREWGKEVVILALM